MEVIETLLFDFGGTLDLPGRHWLDRFLVHYRAAGFDLGREELDLAYAHATRLGYRAGERIRGYGMRQLVRTLVGWQFDYIREHLPQTVPPAFDLQVGAIAEPFCAESAAGLARSRKILAVLAEELRLGVISNFYGNLERVLSEAEIAPLLSAAIDSTREGIYKPDPALFELALARLGASASRTMMVGDSIAKDCAPAKALGMKTAWIAGPGAHRREPSDGHADYVIYDLAELIEICGSSNSRSNPGRRAG